MIVGRDKHSEALTRLSTRGLRDREAVGTEDRCWWCWRVVGAWSRDGRERGARYVMCCVLCVVLGCWRLFRRERAKEV